MKKLKIVGYITTGMAILAGVYALGVLLLLIIAGKL